MGVRENDPVIVGKKNGDGVEESFKERHTPSAPEMKMSLTAPVDSTTGEEAHGQDFGTADK